jgi:hypothetical protein
LFRTDAQSPCDAAPDVIHHVREELREQPGNFSGVYFRTVPKIIVDLIFYHFYAVMMTFVTPILALSAQKANPVDMFGNGLNDWLTTA